MTPRSSGSRTVAAEESSAPPSIHASASLEAAHFYPYDSIGGGPIRETLITSLTYPMILSSCSTVKKWESYLGWKGVAKGYAKKFLSQTSLIDGSSEAKGDPVSVRERMMIPILHADTK